MKKSVTIKFVGEQRDIEQVIEELMKKFNARQTSDFLPNLPRDKGVHCYVMLFPESEVVQRLGAKSQ
jgi:hypothetical protein